MTDQHYEGKIQKAAVYLRKSCATQPENARSISDQLLQAHAFCEGQGWAVVGEYIDPSLSRSDEARG